MNIQKPKAELGNRQFALAAHASSLAPNNKNDQTSLSKAKWKHGDPTDLAQGFQGTLEYKARKQVKETGRDHLRRTHSGVEKINRKKR